MLGNLRRVMVLMMVVLPLMLAMKDDSPLHYPTVIQLPNKIYAGEVHFSRIPVQYWEHRIQTIKSMGMNALSVYIMWNYHQIERGIYDYQTGNKNISKFLDLAKKYNMSVLIRPGPYVCAEWDFGGFPARLLAINNLKLRAHNSEYLQEVRLYFQSLVPVLKPYLSTAGGPIILLQIENQYGFYGNDKTYIEYLRQIWRELDFVIDQYYVDWVENLQKSHWNGANIGINNAITEEQFTFAKTFEKTGMLLGGQIYSGWLTHWGEQWQGKNISQFLQEFGFLLANNHSFSMYMVHGGTNFGLTAGANGFKGKSFDFGGHITSYDYDAPINEQGTSQDKYFQFKSMIKPYVTWPIPDPPAPIPMIEIPPFTPRKIAALFANLPEATFIKSSNAHLFESNELKMFKQGFVLYETTLAKKTYFMDIIVHDFGLLYLDGQFLMFLDRGNKTEHNITIDCKNVECKLSILVQALGHINFDHDMETDRKGLFKITDTYSTKYLWDIYKINVDQNVLKWKAIFESRTFPALLRTTFTLATVGDTYLNMSKYVKGYVWVNGYNLGRYWNKGPGLKLFCPGVWLKQGLNQIYVLDLLTEDSLQISGEKTLK